MNSLNNKNKNNDFELKLSEYITNAVNSLKTGRSGYHEMNITNQHLLGGSIDSKNVSCDMLNINNESSEIASQYLASQCSN